MVAGGSSGEIKYSFDGNSWLSGGTIPFSSVNRVAWNGLIWVAVGTGVNDTIATSSDGINWTGRGKTVFSSTGEGVAWSGSLWVAVGSGTNSIAYSTNGIDWTASTTNPFATSVTGNGVAWNGRMWVATGRGADTGENTLAYSYNGIDWTGAGRTVFTISGYGIAWNGLTWVAGGEGTNTLAYSFDGVTWSAILSSPFGGSGRVRAIAWNGSIWVAVGSGSAYIAYTNTYNGTQNWTTISGTVPFTASGRGIAWNGSIWVAVGNGTNTLATSVSGTADWVVISNNSFSSIGYAVASRRILPYIGSSLLGGPTGVTGPTGIGVTGRTGPTGVGFTGFTGPTGVGFTGFTGPTGVGFTGPTGPAGGGGGASISILGSTAFGSVLTVSTGGTGIFGNSSFVVAGPTGFVGIGTTTPATQLDVSGGVTIRNGYRPIYLQVTGSSLTVNTGSFGTHYNITNSGFSTLTLPTINWSNDSNGYWVFRNNTSSYLSTTVTYTSAGTTSPTNPVIIPPSNTTTIMVTYPSGTTSNYVLF
jgi:hypothetical protein